MKASSASGTTRTPMRWRGRTPTSASPRAAALVPVIAPARGAGALEHPLLPLGRRGHLRPPFAVLAETPRNDAVNFLTGAGGFLQQVVFGYTGLRLGPDGLSPAFRPVLPSRIRRLVLRNVAVRGRRYDIVVERDSARFEPR